MRINKYIASCGICSRRKAEEYIVQGRVWVNGKKITDLSVQINEISDEVCLDHKQIVLEEKKIYLMLNKPRGYITTNKEQFSRKSIVDLIDETIRVFPIGRLDMDTEGLLLLTNDGEFANQMMHPKNKVKKKYIVQVDKNVTPMQIEKLKKGVDIGGYITKPAIVDKIGENKVEITISEGKNRQVRRMCSAVSLNVISLKRIQIGNLSLGNLPIGKYRYLSEKEIKNI